jgi:hypothetical protein
MSCCALQAGIVYGVSIGDPNRALGVFLPGKHVSDGEAFAWELILTFVLVRAALFPSISQCQSCPRDFINVICGEALCVLIVWGLLCKYPQCMLWP